MPNYMLTLCYDGTRYKGWQKQGNTDNTIQAKAEDILFRILGEIVELAGSGRTDAGVHARRQVCSFRTGKAIDCEAVLSSLRRYLPEDIGAISLEEAEPRFHARLSCTEKTYVYTIWNSPEPNVFDRRYMFALPDELDIGAMRDAADKLIGRHDFSAFCANKHMKKSAVRDLRSISITEEGRCIRIACTADGFLYNMVRLLTGTLLSVGTGKLTPGGAEETLRSLDRSRAGPIAPAHGLTLWDVKYR